MEKVDIDDITATYFPEYAKLSDDDKYDFWHDLSDKDKYLINYDYIIANGNPDYNYLMCNEPGRLDKLETLFDYPSMYEFDKSWWEFQRDSIWEEIEKQKKEMEKGSKFHTPLKVSKSINNFNEQYKEYSIYCSGDWFRMIDNDVLLYSQVISVKWFIFYEIELYLDELQEATIPYKMNDDLEFMTLLNESNPSIKYKANGREYEVDELNSLMTKYLNNDVLEIIESKIKESSLHGVTFRCDRGYDNDSEAEFDPFTDFIFLDEESLRSVRLTHFLSDFKSIQKPFEILTELVESVKSIVTTDFERIYEENRTKFLHKQQA